MVLCPNWMDIRFLTLRPFSPMAKGPEAICLTQLIKDYDQNFF